MTARAPIAMIDPDSKVPDSGRRRTLLTMPHGTATALHDQEWKPAALKTTMSRTGRFPKTTGRSSRARRRQSPSPLVAEQLRRSMELMGNVQDGRSVSGCSESKLSRLMVSLSRESSSPWQASMKCLDRNAYDKEMCTDVGILPLAFIEAMLTRRGQSTLRCTKSTLTPPNGRTQEPQGR